MSLDTIELRGIRAFGHHGADAGEKVVAQPSMHARSSLQAKMHASNVAPATSPQTVA